MPGEQLSGIGTDIGCGSAHKAAGNGKVPDAVQKPFAVAISIE